MDLSGYLKRGSSASYRIADRERFCMNCGQKIAPENAAWFKRSFCDENCYRSYVQLGIERKQPYRHD